MQLSDDEFMEWHNIVLRQRNKYRWLLENIVNGLPSISGMASDYRPMTLKEITTAAKELLK